MVSENIKSQWSKFMINLFEYVPTKYEATKREWAVRRFIWNFKEGKQSIQAAQIVAQKIMQTISREDAKDIIFACVPASSAEKNVRRYKVFANEVCRLVGFKNAYNAISVEGERLAIHESKSRKFVNNVEIINFDKAFFAGQKVIVFDDILTQGYSYARFACSLENIGAKVLGGFFLGKTIMKYN